MFRPTPEGRLRHIDITAESSQQSKKIVDSLRRLRSLKATELLKLLLESRELLAHCLQLSSQLGNFDFKLRDPLRLTGTCRFLDTRFR